MRRTCPVCSSELEKSLLSAPALDVLDNSRYEYAHCEHCGVLALVCNGAQSGVVDYSDSGYYSREESKAPRIVAKLAEFASIQRIKIVKSALGIASLEGLNILDIGCGKGRFLAKAQEEGAIVMGVEPTKRSYEAAKVKLGGCLVNQPMSKELFSKSSAEVVTMWHVFEHLPEPHKMLEACRWVLKANGILIVAVPNYRGWIAKFGGVVWFNLDPPRHVIHYTEPTLRKMVQAHGLDVFWVSYRYPELTYFSTLQTILNKLPITNNFLFNMVKKNKAALPRNATRFVRDFVLTCIVGACLLPLVFFITSVSSVVKSSDCITLVARKKRW